MASWFIWALVAVVCWGLWAIASKLLGDSYSAAQAQAFSTLGILPVLLVLLFSKSVKKPSGMKTNGTITAFVAGLLTCLGNIGYYLALNKGGKAATIIPLTALYPLVTVLLAVLFLRERLGGVQALGIAVSLAAIYLFNVQPESGMFSPALIYALPPILLWGVAGLLQKISTNHISAEASARWFLLAFIPIAAFLIWREGFPKVQNSSSWLWVTLLGFFFAFGNLALLAAFSRHGKASVIAPMAALYPLVSIPIALIFFRERVGGREIAGIILGLLAVVALTREKADLAAQNLQ